MTYRGRLPILIALLAGLSVASCGGSSAPANLDEFLDRFLTELCRISLTCGSMPDMATCRASLQLETSDILQAKADIAAGTTRFDSAKAAACLEWAHGLYASACTLSSTPLPLLNDACDELVVGTVADDNAYFQSTEYTSGKCEHPNTCASPQCCVGTCGAKPAPVPVGGDCSTLLPDQYCVNGSYCVPTSATCVAPSKVAGSACSSSIDCAPPLFCDLDSAAGAGTCQPPAATGAPCNPNVGYGACDDLHDFCDTATSTCTPAAAVGAPCDPLQVLSCVGYANCLGSTCVARSPERGACNPTDGPACLGDLECSPTTNTCGFPATSPACL